MRAITTRHRKTLPFQIFVVSPTGNENNPGMLGWLHNNGVIVAVGKRHTAHLLSKLDGYACSGRQTQTNDSSKPIKGQLLLREIAKQINEATH